MLVMSSGVETSLISKMSSARPKKTARDSSTSLGMTRWMMLAVEMRCRFNALNRSTSRIMTSLFRFGILALAWLVTANHNDAGPTSVDAGRSENAATKKSEHTNRLAHEKSPYLLQHAHNPVDWYPWGEEAFAKARRENKPIFLSIGYSTCHWCHVMAHESFESEEVAATMNREFLNIKVDREERPDVDRVYMTFVQATTGSGGWPMSVWLTPALEPFYGGTYFPPTSRWGRPGFVEVLEEIARVWREERDKVLQSASRIVERMRSLR